MDVLLCLLVISSFVIFLVKIIKGILIFTQGNIYMSRKQLCFYRRKVQECFMALGENRCGKDFTIGYPFFFFLLTLTTLFKFQPPSLPTSGLPHPLSQFCLLLHYSSPPKMQHFFLVYFVLLPISPNQKKYPEGIKTSSLFQLLISVLFTLAFISRIASDQSRCLINIWLKNI